MERKYYFLIGYLIVVVLHHSGINYLRFIRDNNHNIINSNNNICYHINTNYNNINNDSNNDKNIIANILKEINLLKKENSIKYRIKKFLYH